MRRSAHPRLTASLRDSGNGGQHDHPSDAARDGRVGDRGNGPRVAQAGGRHGRGRRDAGRGLDRQGRRRGPRPGERDRREDPRRRGRHGAGRGRAGRDRERNGAGARGRRAPAQAARGRGCRGAPAAGRGPPRRRREGQIVDIVTPAGGESVTEGTILEWAKAVGDTVEDGETVVEISTDKVDMELPAPAERHADRDPRRGGRDRHGRPGHRAHEGRRRRRAAKQPAAERRAAATARRGPRRTAPLDARRRPISPVARRDRRGRGHRPRRASQGTGPRRPDHEGGRPRRRRATAAPPRPRRRAPARTPQPLKGGAAMLARYMDESRSIPTATSFRTMTVTTMDGRRKELKAAGQKVSFTHLIAYAIALVVQQEMPVMAHHFEERDGKPTRIDDDAVNLGIAVDVEKKDGSRTLMVPVIRDAGRLRVHRLQGRVRRPHRQGAREQAHRRPAHRREHLAHQPGRDRHDRVGPAAHDRPGHDRRHRRDRLPRRPRERRLDDRRREGHDDDLDLRPPDHPGGGVGAVPAEGRGLPPGRERLLRGRLRARSASSSARRRRRPRPPPPRRPRRPRRRRPAGDGAPSTRSCCRPCRPRPRSSRPTAPTATSRRSSTRSAPSPRATPRSTPTTSA